MSFMLPLAITGVGTISGFVAGYYYGGSNSDTETNLSVDMNLEGIPENELKNLKRQSTQHELKEELIKFDKKKLNKVDSNNNIVQLTEEQKLLENLRQKISVRRSSIEPLPPIPNM